MFWWLGRVALASILYLVGHFWILTKLGGFR
jgi:hypothetical protein